MQSECTAPAGSVHTEGAAPFNDSALSAGRCRGAPISALISRMLCLNHVTSVVSPETSVSRSVAEPRKAGVGTAVQTGNSLF